MIFLNPLPIFYWFLLFIPLVIFLFNNSKQKRIKFSTLRFLNDNKIIKINRLKILNIFLLILRTLFIFFLLLLISKPYFGDEVSNTNLSDDKILNVVLVDDLFTSINGENEGYNFKSKINDIINAIQNSYPYNSRLVILSIERGLIFDGFNKKNEEVFFLNDKFVQYKKFNNLNPNYRFETFFHIISNFNNHSNLKINNFYKKFVKDTNPSRTYLHIIENVKDNQFINSVSEINTSSNKLNYEIIVGNTLDENVQLDLLVYQNFYEYNSKFKLNNSLPIINRPLSISANSQFIDTLNVSLNRNYQYELLFEIVRKNSFGNKISDDRYQDNTYSFVKNRPEKVNLKVLYNNDKTMKIFKNIINSFKINTFIIDSSFFDIEYIKTDGLNKYSKTAISNDTYVFLGYEIFNQSDIFHKISGSDLKNKILIFPSFADLINDTITINISDSLKVKSFLIDNNEKNYQTSKFKDTSLFTKDSYKLKTYYYHENIDNSIMYIDENVNVWSKFYHDGNEINLFGFMLDYGNDFFSKMYVTFLPIFYNIILDEKTDFDYNLKIGDSINFKQMKGKKVLNNVKGDSIIFSHNESKKVLSKGVQGLIENDKVKNLYAFNIDPKNYSTESITDFEFNNIKIDYNQSTDFTETFIYNTNTNPIIKLLVFLILTILFFETLISNAAKPKKTKE